MKKYSIYTNFNKFYTSIIALIFISLSISKCDSSEEISDTAKLGLITQKTIAMDTPLNRVQFLGAHNAWNDGNNEWNNQRYAMNVLLQNGIQAIDLDLHWNDNVVKLCHGDCDKFWGAADNYNNELKKIADFAYANPKIILFIDLEDRVGRQAEVEGPIYHNFGSLLYKPSDKPVGRWETPREMLAKGKRIIIKSANNTYDSSLIWHSHIFSVDTSPGWNYKQVKYFDADTCSSDGIVMDQDLMFGFMDSKLGKFLLPDGWVDQTGTIDVGNIPALLNCGVNFIDADRWISSRIEAAIWTWGENEPNNYGSETNNDGGEDCATQRSDGRWNDVVCTASYKFACQSTTNPDDWKVTMSAGKWENGFDQCESEYPGYVFSTPGNAYQNKKILTASAGGTTYLAFSDKENEGKWDIYNDLTPNQWIETGYNNNQDISKTLRIPGVKKIKISAAGDVQSGDKLYIFDSNRKLMKQYSGIFNEIFTLEDSAIIVQLISNASVSGNFDITVAKERVCTKVCELECHEEKKGCHTETVCNDVCKKVCY